MSRSRAEKSQPTAAVVGAGLVGCLTAYGLAKSGWDVTLYEKRPDPRTWKDEGYRLRSILLALSARGIHAIRSVDADLCDRLLQNVLPVSARMVHPLNAPANSQPYSSKGESINSVDRHVLNLRMLEECAAYGEGLKLRFGCQLRKANLDARELTFEVDGRIERVRADFVVGADGTHSAVREQLGRYVNFDFSKRYIPEIYLELSIPATADGQFALDPRHLHIWPRKSHMLIALPNSDRSFTCTLFVPAQILRDLDEQATSDKAAPHVAWFREHYGDALPLLGVDQISTAFTEYPRGPLVTIECSTYNYRDRCVIIGDAANSMVPFYGQGLNAGFESVRVLLEHIPTPAALTEAALDQYSAVRHPALVSICQLALRNHREMSTQVISPLFLARKRIDRLLLSVLGPDRWQPLYELVTFRPDVTYDQALKREKRQARIVETVALALIGVVGLGSWQLARTLLRR